jgi:DNA recombination protein RmuC
MNREESSKVAKEGRFELFNTLTMMTEQSSENLKQINISLREELARTREESTKNLKGMQDNFDKNVDSFNRLQKEKFEQLDIKQSKLIEATEKKLEEMRVTVDEKLQKTLNERLSQSFETVGKQLQAVQEGLGEMKNLASDVGGLKKVLTNTKLRGNLGELQLAMLLEQVLAPNQYEANVKTKKGSDKVVEFAIKLPGQEEGLDHIWLPIDAKFPKDYYEALEAAHETGDKENIKKAQEKFEREVINMAKDISSKYIDPPFTTPFAIMFLPFEGIYAEVVRKASLMEVLHKQYNVLVTGPTTLAAMLSSLQMGFRTLAIEKRTGEVWKVLGAVKTEFETFGNLLAKSQKHFQTGLDDLDTLIGRRTNQIKRKLREVEFLPEDEVKVILPEVTAIESSEDQEVTEDI